MSGFYNDEPERPPQPTFIDFVVSISALIKLALGFYLGYRGIHTHDWTMLGVGVLLLTTGGNPNE